MRNIVYYNFNKLVSNQIRLKNVKRQIYPILKFKYLIYNVFFFKLLSLKDSNLLESLFSLRLLSSRKAYISFFKKKYKEFDFILNLNLKQNQIDYSLLILMSIIIPLAKKRSLLFKISFDNNNNLILINNNYNLYTFFPNVFFFLK